MGNMHAVRIHGYGGTEAAYEEAPRPIPQASEVLIRGTCDSGQSV